VEQLRQELRTAVRLHKVSDVPMGVFLSGGVDSSLNAALFSEGEPSPSTPSPSATRASTKQLR
jgi:asparagine synthase (glutamine-hydrolysing)